MNFELLISGMDLEKLDPETLEAIRQLKERFDALFETDSDKEMAALIYRDYPQFFYDQNDFQKLATLGAVMSIMYRSSKAGMYNVAEGICSFSESYCQLYRDLEEEVDV